MYLCTAQCDNVQTRETRRLLLRIQEVLLLQEEFFYAPSFLLCHTAAGKLIAPPHHLQHSKKPRRPQCRLLLLHFAVKDASERERFDPCTTDICLGRRQQFLFFFRRQCFKAPSTVRTLGPSQPTKPTTPLGGTQLRTRTYVRTREGVSLG